MKRKRSENNVINVKVAEYEKKAALAKIESLEIKLVFQRDILQIKDTKVRAAKLVCFVDDLKESLNALAGQKHKDNIAKINDVYTKYRKFMMSQKEIYTEIRFGDYVVRIGNYGQGLSVIIGEYTFGFTINHKRCHHSYGNKEAKKLATRANKIIPFCKWLLTAKIEGVNVFTYIACSFLRIMMK